MFEILLTLLLAAHLLCMNVASAGPLVGAWLVLQSEGGELARRMFRLSGAGLILGSLLGAALLVWPSEGMRAALERFPADTYWFAALELAFSGVCIAALVAGGGRLARRPWLVLCIAVLTASNLLYHFPPLMAVIGKLADDPAWAIEESIDRAALLQLWRRPEVLALWVHFSLASVAVAAVAALWPASLVNWRAPVAYSTAAARQLGTLALVASALQIPVGLWLIATTSQAERQSVMGDNLAATITFAGGVMAALWLLQTLLGVALGEDGRAVRRAGWLLLAVTILMTATLRSSRNFDNCLAEIAKLQSAATASDHVK